jgi:hypothetical protein
MLGLEEQPGSGRPVKKSRGPIIGFVFGILVVVIAGAWFVGNHNDKSSEPRTRSKSQTGSTVVPLVDIDIAPADRFACQNEADTVWTAMEAQHAMTGTATSATNTTELVNELVTADLLKPDMVKYASDELPPPAGTWSYDASAGTIVGGCAAVK